MSHHSTSRSPRLQAVWSALVGFTILIVLMLCFHSSAHAATTYHRPHAVIRHLHQPVKKQQDAAPANFFDLSPEQQALIQWVLDSATPRLAPEQARQIVLLVYDKAKSISIDPIEFISIMRLESRFNPHARSSEGAQGLMQVLSRVHRHELAGHSAYDIETSISVGTQILSDCLDKNDHNLPKALNCYSGGGGRAYNQLFARFHREADHYVVYSLFNSPELPPEPEVTARDLPRDEAVYDVALR